MPVTWVPLPRPGVKPRALSNLRGGVDVWTAGLKYFLKFLKIVLLYGEH